MTKKSPLKAITADSTLVSAAFREGQSRVPTYDPNVTAMQANLAQTATQPIFKTIEKYKLEEREDEKEREKQEQIEIKSSKREHEKRKNEFDKYIVASNTALEDGDGLPQNIFHVIENGLGVEKEAYDRANPLDGSDLEGTNNQTRLTVSQNLQKITQTAVESRTIMQTLGGAEFWPKRSEGMHGTKNEAILNMWLNQKGEDNAWSNGGVTSLLNDKRELEYNFIIPEGFEGAGKTETYTAVQLKEMFSPRERVATEKILAGSSATLKDALTHFQKPELAGKYNHLQRSEDVFGIITENKNTDKVIRDFAMTRQDAQPREGYGNGLESPYKKGCMADKWYFDDSLNQNFYKEMTETQKVGLADTDGDGDVTTKEENAFYAMDMENKKRVINTIIDPSNPLYNQEVSAILIADEQASIDGKAYDAKITKLKAANPSKTSTIITPPGDAVAGDAATDPFPPNEGKSGVPPVSDAKDGKYYLGKNGITYLFTKAGGYNPIPKAR